LHHRKGITDAYERELANDIGYNLGRPERSVLLSALRSIASCTSALMGVSPTAEVAGKRTNSR